MQKSFKYISTFLVGVLISSFTILQDAPKGLTKGDKAPDFEMMDVSGKPVKLKEKLKSGAVVLVFYRGQWCPYCNKYLSRLEDSLKMIKAKGASVVAVSPEAFEGAKQTVEKTKASFPVIYDEGLSLSNKYRVNYKIDDKTLEMYKGYGIDFNKANGKNGANLPVPATYIISKDGTIKYVFFNPDFTQRASVKEILDNI